MDGKKNLYVCIVETNNHYRIWSMDLEDLLSCSCMFDEESKTFNRCSHHIFVGSSHGRGETMKLCSCLHRQDSFGNKVPYCMGCHMDDSMFILAGGVYPKGEEFEVNELVTASNQIFVLDLDRKWKNKLIKPTRYPKHTPWICHFRGYMYVMGRPHLIQHKPQVDNQFEMCNIETGSWMSLPNPPPINSWGPNLIYYTHLGNMIVASVKAFGEDTFTLHSFDLFRSQRDYISYTLESHPRPRWKPVKLHFDGKHFPFIEGALVLDLKGMRDKVMFTYHEDANDIQVSRIAVENVDGDVIIKVKHHQLLGMPSKFPRLAALSTPEWYEWGSTFGIVHLENQKVCLLRTLPFHTRENRALNAEYRSVVAIVLEYELLDSGCFSCKFVATRVFGYRFHYSPSKEPWLIGCTVY